jgi:hypothetical protein
MDARMAARTRYVWIGASVALYASFAASLRARGRRASAGLACEFSPTPPAKAIYYNLLSLLEQQEWFDDAVGASMGGAAGGG